jgi:hypothetical protein
MGASARSLCTLGSELPLLFAAMHARPRMRGLGRGPAQTRPESSGGRRSPHPLSENLLFTDPEPIYTVYWRYYSTYTIDDECTPR